MTDTSFQILDTTLRDGSYVIDFQFTAEDTALITSLLDYAGIPFIEVAHGLGLGADRAGKGDQAATDEAYIKAAVASSQNSKVGSFFIPGIGNDEDIRIAADNGMDFIRIGTNVTEVGEAKHFIQLSKELGLTVFTNLMKSYAIPSTDFAEQCVKAEEYGTDYVCLVDSAGGMLPDNVREYIEAFRSKGSIPIGFHGHNNLSMSVANTLEAIDAGAAIVDTSLQGMGRSEGNTMTEVLVSILQRQGLCNEININSLLDTSEALIRPMLKESGYSSMGVVSGRAQFHSSFMGKVIAVAKDYEVDPRDLILKITEEDQVNAPQELLEKAAKMLLKKSPIPKTSIGISTQASATQDTLITRVIHRAKQLKESSRKKNIPSIFNVVVSLHEDEHVSPFVESGFGVCMSNVMLKSTSQLQSILDQVSPFVDYVLLDDSNQNVPISDPLGQCIRYNDIEMWCQATCNHIQHLLNDELAHKNILLIGIPSFIDVAETRLKSLHCNVSAYSSLEPLPDDIGATLSQIDALIALSPRSPCVNSFLVKEIPDHCLLYDGGIGSIDEEAIQFAEKHSIQVVRIDMRPTLAAIAIEHIQLKEMVDRRMGKDIWDGVTVVAGGLIGRDGDVIVDHIQEPTKILGVADGKGGIQPIDESDPSIQKIRKEIIKKQLG
jgi:4-hydroxy-2-oxovalerate aldolase